MLGALAEIVTVAPVQSTIRFIGLLNAAVWLGATVFFTFFVGTAFFTPEAKQLMILPHIPGAVAQMIIVRYLTLQEWCAGIALVHLVLEWFLTGKVFPKASLFVLVGLLGISLLGSRLLVPKMRYLHLVKYAVQSKPEERAAAERSFAILHGTSSATNLLALGGLLFYYWKVSMGNQGGRTGGGMRFRA